MFEDDFPFPKDMLCSSLEGIRAFFGFVAYVSLPKGISDPKS